MRKSALLICLYTLLLSACSGGGASDTRPAASSSAVSSVTSVSSSSVVSSTPSSSVASSSASSVALTFNSFTGDDLRLIGRFDTSENGRAHFTWPGSALEFSFEGTTASIAIASNGQTRFQVEVDGVTADLWVNSGEASYPLASGLNQGTHHVRLTRVTESFATVTSFISDPQVDGERLNPPESPQKRLLVLGDSITAGYGIEGSSHACSYSTATSNQQLTYAALTAKALDADLHTIAWSGIGAWRSYGEATPVNPNILARYQRTLADDSTSVWNTSAYQPDAILITIGTNDYWQGSASDEYRLAMIELVEHIQSDYTGKPVYLIISPMLSGAVRDAQKAVLDTLATTGVQVLDLGKIEAADGLGCDYHPNTITQARMGVALEQQLKTDLEW